jgi:hypothetical protein
MLQRVQENIVRRAALCIEVGCSIYCKLKSKFVSYPHDSFIFMQVTESVISIGFLDTAKYVNIIFFRKKSAILPICTVRKAV